MEGSIDRQVYWLDRYINRLIKWIDRQIGYIDILPFR